MINCGGSANLPSLAALICFLIKKAISGRLCFPLKKVSPSGMSCPEILRSNLMALKNSNRLSRI